MTDRHFDTDALRQIAESLFDYPADLDGYVRVPRQVWEQVRCDMVAAADELDLRAIEAMRAAA